MHRTEGANNVANLFTDGPPGTTVEEDFMNAVQEEICAVVEGAGLTLKTATTETRDQLLEALQALFVSPDGVYGKNALINGDFRISQRGASGTASYTAATTPANSDDTYLHDRWILLSDGNDIVDVTQSTEAPDGALLSCGLDVETVNKKFGIFQPIEQKNCVHMIGDVVSLSFQAKVSDITKLDNIKAMVVSWDGAADTITSDIISLWNAEDVTPTLVANWTAENTPTNLNVTAAWAKYTINNISIDTAGATNIGVFIWSDGFCDTVANFLYITNVQLEKNSEASVYGMRSMAAELVLCQRYYCKSYDQDVAHGAASDIGDTDFQFTALNNGDHNCYATTRFATVMRVIPSITLYDIAGNSGKITMAVGNNIAGTAANIGMSGFRAHGTNGAADTSRKIEYHYLADGEL